MDHNKDVLIALSGGLDSAAAAIMLRAQGYNTHALFINMHGREYEIKQAKSVAQIINIPLTIIDATSEFNNHIISYFKSELSRARTPAPCSFCNPNLKWKILFDYATQHNFDHIATGHYVQTIIINGHTYVTKGSDPTKDQSYYLWDLPQAILSRALFPLGNTTKASVRAMLGDMGFDKLSTASESMSLCFVPQGVNYADFVKSTVQCTAGDVVDKSDNIIGSHQGVALYTIGQRRGFECKIEGAAVIAMDAAKNQLVVSCDQQDLYARKFRLKDWRIGDFRLLKQDNISLKVRGLGRNPLGKYLLEVKGDELEVELLDDSAWAVAAGQPVVFYAGDILCGGGYVSEVVGSGSH